MNPGEDGRFGYKQLELYWSDQNRHPFLVRLNGAWAGVILVQKGSQVSGNPDVWDMAEFFVLRGFRRRGIGIQMALNAWGKFHGLWEVRVMQRNDPASQFWRHAVSLFVGESATSSQFEKNGERWQVFSFASPGPKAALSPDIT